MNTGYSIPTVDISNETERQFTVDREKGQYLGHPTTVLLDDNKTIVCVYPKCHGCGKITLKKSYDGGITWSDRLPVPASFSTSLEVPTIFKTYDKNGKRRLLIFSSFFPIRMSVSEDDGETWSELSPIGPYGGVTSMGEMLSLGDGEYMAFFHDDGTYFTPTGAEHRIELWVTGEGEAARTQVLHFYSKDDGETWSEPQDNFIVAETREGDNWRCLYRSVPRATGPLSHTVYSVISKDGGLTWSRNPKKIAHVDGLALCEPAAVFSPDKKQIAVVMREDTHKHSSYIITSDDMGETWSEPRELPSVLMGDRHCIRYLNDGRLFISFRDKCIGSPSQGSWAGWVGTYDDLVNGREGQYRVFIMKNSRGSDCGYPGIVVLPDDTVVATSYGHFTDGEPAYVMTVRFKPEELDKKLML